MLEVGDEEKFASRPMVDAPENGDKVNEQLLDGQQRLTALWRSLNDKYQDRTYLIEFESDPSGEGDDLPTVAGQARWIKNDTRYPVWADDPADLWRRGYLPISLLRPSDIKDEIDDWVERAIPEDVEDKFSEYKKITSLISDLRTRVREFNLPYLALPARTPREVALDVFIKMNTSSVKLSTYDIVVALVEDATGKSLHDHVDELSEAVPRAQEYADLPSLVLDVVALHQDRVPSQAGYKGIDYRRMLSEWASVVDGVRWMVSFLEDECVFDERRLPTYTVLPVLAALHKDLPSQPDELGNARHLLQKYLWRAFLTSRYEQASATYSFQDFRALRSILRGEADENAVPILNEESFPAPTPGMLLQSDWPKRRSILSRGVLALSLKAGAEDLADGKKATVATITSKDQPREYHHLFPESTLTDVVPDDQIYRALNCALVTWRTNRVISNKDPIAYLKERAELGALGEPEMKRRLRTHLIPFEELAVGYDGLDEAQKAEKLCADYTRFLNARAELMAKAATRAFAGLPLDTPELQSDGP